MFRSLLPRTTPRAAAVRSARPVPSHIVPAPYFPILRSTRGYASESGKLRPFRLLRALLQKYPGLPKDRQLTNGMRSVKVNTMSLSSVVVSLDTLLPSKLARRVSRCDLSNSVLPIDPVEVSAD